jgi:hypothetical protein
MRKSAGELLQHHHEFLQLFQQQQQKKMGTQNAILANEDDDDGGGMPEEDDFRTNVTTSLTGSVRRHTTFLDYVKFERSVTTLIATMVPSVEFANLLTTLTSYNNNNNNNNTSSTATATTMTLDLNIIPISELKKILKERNQFQW